MNTKIHTHQLDMSDALREYAVKHIEELVTRIYNKQNPTLDIEFSDVSAGREKMCKVTLHVPPGKTLVASAQDVNPYAAVDLAAEKISRELRRFKEKRQDAARHGVSPADLPALENDGSDDEEAAEFDADLEAKLV